MTFADLGLDCDVVFEDVREVPRELWLKARQEGIGGSDAAATMGLSPFKSPFALYVDKVDEVPDEQTERMKRGQQMEDAIAEMFVDDTGAVALSHRPMVRSRRHSFMLFNLDRLVMPDPFGEVELLEAKNVDARMAHEWADGPPLHYRIQVLHGLDVLGLKVGHLAALIGGNEFVHYRIEWDEASVANIIKAEEKFWGEVLMRRPPDVDGDESTKAALAAHFKTPTLESVEVPARMLELIDQRAAAKTTLALAKSRVDAVENEMKMLMGEAELATLDGRVIATWKTVTRAAHEVAESSFRQLAVPKGRGSHE